MAKGRAAGDSISLEDHATSLRQEIERLTAAIEKTAGKEGAEAVQAAAEAARDILQRSASLLDEIAGQAGAAAEKASELAGEGKEQLEGAIRDKPLLAVTVAALGGFVLSSLLRR